MADRYIDRDSIPLVGVRIDHHDFGGDPLDPDYTTLWPQDADVTSMGVTRDLITIDLSGNLHDRPAGMTQAEASLSLNQLIYTAQAAYGEGRVPVQFLLDGGHTDQLLGEPASEALAEGDPMSTLALVNLTDPADLQPVRRYGGNNPDAQALTALRMQLHQLGGLLVQAAKVSRQGGDAALHGDAERTLVDVRAAIQTVAAWQESTP